MARTDTNYGSRGNKHSEESAGRIQRCSVLHQTNCKFIEMRPTHETQRSYRIEAIKSTKMYTHKQSEAKDTVTDYQFSWQFFKSRLADKDACRRCACCRLEAPLLVSLFGRLSIVR